MPPFGSAAVIELRELDRIEQIAAAQLSARAMRDDPVHIAVFGTNPEHRLRQLTRFFATLLMEANVTQAVFRLPTEGRTVAVVGEVYRFLATGEETNGKYAQWE